MRLREKNNGNSFPRVRLGDVCDYRTGKIAVDTLDADTYVSTENMLPERCGITTSSGLPTTPTTQAYYTGDVLVSNIRPYFKKIWFASSDGGCSNDVLVFKTKENCAPEYLYYVLSDDKFFDYSTTTAKGTKMPRGDKAAIMQYTLPLPPLPVQRSIAATLSCLDDKIELNRRINANLEAQAQALFGNYFSQRHKDTKGWQTYKLFDIVDIVYGKGLSTKELTPQGFRVFGGNGQIGWYSKYLYEKPRVLISCRGAASGKVLCSRPFSFVTSNSLVMLEKKPEYYSFLKYWAYNFDFTKYVTGSAQPQLTIEALNNVTINIPPAKERNDFSQMVEQFANMEEILLQESETLAAIRDTLLPGLMSGEIEVKEAAQ